MFRSLAAVVLVALFLPVARADETPPKEAAPVEGTGLVHLLMDAFNGHDPDAMGRLVTDDVEVLYVDEAGRAQVGSRGRDDLVQQMHGYFARLPDVRSAVESIAPAGRFFGVTERVRWTRDGRETTRFSLSVYETRGPRIARVWYFPAQR